MKKCSARMKKAIAFLRQKAVCVLPVRCLSTIISKAEITVFIPADWHKKSSLFQGTFRIYSAFSAARFSFIKRITVSGMVKT